MAEQRDNDRKPEEQRQRSQEQQHRHDQAPSSHRNGVSRHDTQRGHHGIPGASMTVEHQRKRNHANAQGHHREKETDAAADHDKPPALRRGQDALGEIRNAGRSCVTECRHIDRLRSRDPGHKQRQQQRAEPEHRAKRWRAHHLGRIPGGSRFASFAAAAQFIKTERRKWAEQGKPSRERKQQRQHRIAEHGARKHQAKHWINNAQDDGVTGYGFEIVPAAPQCIVQIG